MPEENFFERVKPLCPVCRQGRITVNTRIRDAATRELIYQCDLNSDHQFTLKEYITYASSAFRGAEQIPGRGKEIAPPFQPSAEEIRQMETTARKAGEEIRKAGEMEREAVRKGWEALTPKVPRFKFLPFFKKTAPQPGLPPEEKEKEIKPAPPPEQLSLEDWERQQEFAKEFDEALRRETALLVSNLKTRYEYLIIKIEQIVRLASRITDNKVRKSISDELTNIYRLVQQFHKDFSERRYDDAQNELSEGEARVSSLVKLIKESPKAGSVLKTMEERAKIRIASEQAQSGEWTAEDIEKWQKTQAEKEIRTGYERQVRGELYYTETELEVSEIEGKIGEIDSAVRGGLNTRQAQILLEEVKDILDEIDKLEKSG